MISCGKIQRITGLDKTISEENMIINSHQAMTPLRATKNSEIHDHPEERMTDLTKRRKIETNCIKEAIEKISSAH